jgi:hypothetical protein
MLRFACLITGDDYQMLKSDTPSSRKKVYILFTVIWLPVMMWFVNITMIASGIYKASAVISLTAGLVAGLMIFIIERIIIMGNGSKPILVFRVILGLIIATLGSIFWDEILFKADIDQRLGVNLDMAVKQTEGEVRSSFAARTDVCSAEVAKRKQDWDIFLIEVKQEADGTGGSGQKGVSEITRLKMAIAKQKEDAYRQAKIEFDSVSKSCEAEINRKLAETKAKFDGGALLHRIEAMFELVSGNPFMLAIYVLVTLLLFFMEFIVVLQKNFLKKTNYERRLEMIEEIGRKRMDQLRLRDAESFDHATLYPKYRNTNEDLRKISQRTVFN